MDGLLFTPERGAFFKKEKIIIVSSGAEIDLSVSSVS